MNASPNARASSAPLAGGRAGWCLVGGTAALLVVAIAALVGTAAETTDGLRAGVRLTARSSLLLFLLAYCAGPLATLWSSRITSGLRANRRFLGLSFALSHGLHAALLLALAQRDPALFWTLTNVGTLLSGGVVYALILLMAATSFPATAAALGGRGWGWLHRVGLHAVWITFLVAFGKRVVLVDVAYALPTALLLLALVLRMAAARRRGRG